MLIGRVLGALFVSSHNCLDSRFTDEGYGDSATAVSSEHDRQSPRPLSPRSPFSVRTGDYYPLLLLSISPDAGRPANHGSKRADPMADVLKRRRYTVSGRDPGPSTALGPEMSFHWLGRVGWRG